MTRRTLAQYEQLLRGAHDCGANPDTREVFVASEGDGAEEAGIDFRTAARLLTNLRCLESRGQQPILVHICSVGGDWNYGIAMYDAIAACRSYVTVLSHGHARSMTSVIPQAADRRVLMPNCEYLVHFGDFTVGGHYQRSTAEAEWVQWENERMLDIYADRCYQGPWFKSRRYGRDGVKEYIRREVVKRSEWYMDARQAVELGFADAVLGDEGVESIDSLL